MFPVPKQNFTLNDDNRESPNYARTEDDAPNDRLAW